MSDKKEKDKLVSVVLCFYNEEKYLREAIQSVFDQTYQNFELILVSDGSTDGSIEIADSFDDPRIKRVYLKETKGLGNARNAGYEVCEGDYIAHHDGDDALVKTKLEFQVRYLEDHPDVMIVSSGCYLMDGEGVVNPEPVGRKYHTDLEIRTRLLFDCCVFNSGGPLFRKELIKEYGVRNDPTVLWCEDYNFWHRSLLYGQINNIDEPMFYYRVNHGSKASQNKKEYNEKYKESMMKTISLAWKNQGFELDEKDILFMFKHFNRKRLIIGKERIVSRRLYKKIMRQAATEDNDRKELLRTFYKEKVGKCLLSHRIIKSLSSS